MARPLPPRPVRLADGGPTTAPSTAPTSAPSASGDPADLDAIYDAIEAQVLDIRELDAVEVARRPSTEALLGAQRVELRQDNPAEYVDAYGATSSSAMGLMPQDQRQRDVFLDLLDGQVAGYYSPEQDELFVVSRGDGWAGSTR